MTAVISSLVRRKWRRAADPPPAPPADHALPRPAVRSSKELILVVQAK